MASTTTTSTTMLADFADADEASLTRLDDCDPSAKPEQIAAVR